MKRGTRWGLGLLAGIVVAAFGGLGWYLAQAVPIGTGYAAKYVCTAAFVSGRDPRAAFVRDVAPVNVLARVIDVDVDREARTVTARALRSLGTLLISSTNMRILLIYFHKPPHMSYRPNYL